MIRPTTMNCWMNFQPMEFKRGRISNTPHWANFLEYLRTRKKPICEIEYGYRSSATAIPGNVAMRSQLRLDWDGGAVARPDARGYLSREYRSPWKLVV